MKIIDFIKALFGLSPKEPQDQTQSNLDIANVQPTSEEYVTPQDEQFSSVEEPVPSDRLDAPSTEMVEPVLEPEIQNDESTNELQDFVDEIDNEYSAVKQKQEETPAVSVQDEIIETTQEQKHDVTSLLDNSPYMSLADSCCDLISELDKLKTEDNQELVTLVGSRIKEGLILSGAQPIAEETAYDVIRHSAVGKSIVRKGTPIASTIEPGVAIDDKVMIKAKVEI